MGIRAADATLAHSGTHLNRRGDDGARRTCL